MCWLMMMSKVAAIMLAYFSITDAAHGKESGNSTLSKARKYLKSEFTRTNPNSVELMLLYREHEIFQQAAIDYHRRRQG